MTWRTQPSDHEAALERQLRSQVGLTQRKKRQPPTPIWSDNRMTWWTLVALLTLSVSSSVLWTLSTMSKSSQLIES
jgi:hypothetical protein